MKLMTITWNFDYELNYFILIRVFLSYSYYKSVDFVWIWGKSH